MQADAKRLQSLAEGCKEMQGDASRCKRLQPLAEGCNRKSKEEQRGLRGHKGRRRRRGKGISQKAQKDMTFACLYQSWCLVWSWVCSGPQMSFCAFGLSPCPTCAKIALYALSAPSAHPCFYVCIPSARGRSLLHLLALFASHSPCIPSARLRSLFALRLAFCRPCGGKPCGLWVSGCSVWLLRLRLTAHGSGCLTALCV